MSTIDKSPPKYRIVVSKGSTRSFASVKSIASICSKECASSSHSPIRAKVLAESTMKAPHPFLDEELPPDTGRMSSQPQAFSLYFQKVYFMASRTLFARASSALPVPFQSACWICAPNAGIPLSRTVGFWNSLMRRYSVMTMMAARSLNDDSGLRSNFDLPQRRKPGIVGEW